MKNTLRNFAIIGGLISLCLLGASQINYTWQWAEIPQYIAEYDEGEWFAGPLLWGLGETLKICAMSLIFALIGGLALFAARGSFIWSLKVPAELFFRTVRNSPMLVQLYVSYFILGPVLDIDRFWVAVCSLSAFHAAYLAPIYKSGFDSIPKGQTEAAQSLGLSPVVIFFRILLPQATRITLPAVTNEAVNLVKNSALLSAIAIFEVVTEGKDIIADTFMSFEIWLTAGALYLLITLPLSSAAHSLEKRFKT